MLKRPSVEDDDEEILRQQEEFYKQKTQQKVIPAATFFKDEGESTSSASKSDEQMDVDPENGNPEATIQDQIANTFEAIPSDMKLKHVVEKNKDLTSIRVLKFDNEGFPKAFRRDPNIKPKKGSIFSQHIKRLKTDEMNTYLPGSSGPISTVPLVIKEKNLKDEILIHTTISKQSTDNLKELATAAQRSTVLTTSDRQQIHTENMKTLKSMSEEEILIEKQKLLSTLDPALIQFLKSQRSKHKDELENRNKTIKEQNEASETVDIQQLEEPKKMLSKPESAGWLHFNEFEANKLAWMKDINAAELKKTKGFEARFDFDGYLLPYNVANMDDSNRHLYHHGDEPERPGYSLQELLLLSRSNIIQQRIMALNTLANILALEQTGIYDQVIDIPFEQIFFVLRVCMDDNTPSVLTSAVKALRNLVYFQIDETCLDNMGSFGMGLVQPILAVDHSSEDDYTINDQQLAETNLLKCLVRTDVLSRIRYVVNTVRPSLETIIYCVEILIRLARDSEFIVNKILQWEGLLNGIVNYFLPQTTQSELNQSCYNMPLHHALKLIRVLSSRSRNVAEHILKKYDLLKISLAYLYEDYFSQNSLGMKLQVECINYWTLLLHYGLALESLSDHQNLILKFLDYHFKHTDNTTSTTLIRQSHLSALLMLLSKAVEKEFNLFPELSKECFAKWINQFNNFDVFKCGHSQITSAILHCATSHNRNFSPLHRSELLESFIESGGFNLATKHIINGSLLLNNYETHKTSANLRSLEAATWFSMDHIIPVMQTNSCIPLLYSLSTCILSVKSSKLKVKFLNHPNIKRYTEKLKAAKYFYNVGNWFTRCESFLIMNLLKTAQSVQDFIDPAGYYDIAVKCLCVFSSEQKLDIKFLLENIVFCPRFYSIEVALANAGVSERNDELSKAWNHLTDIKQVYIDILGLTKNIVTLNATLSLDMSVGNVIPVDWIYTPLVLLYSNQQKENKDKLKDEPKDFFIILNCLRWILIYETYFPSLAESISPTEKYTRLGCLFLGSDNFFLDNALQQLLVLVYQYLVKDENKIDFDQEISGLTNFKDFFVQLLEQYQAVSYGNKVFGNVLLFPLLKRHDVKYRKALWSEYMGVVETFTVRKEEVWLNVHELIYPVDTDYSLFACYSKALAMKKVPENSIMFEIADKNVRQFKATTETSGGNQ